LEGGEIKEDNGRNHIVIAKGTYYKQRLFYINGGLEHNVVRYAQYYTFYKNSKVLGICNFKE
jgi:hypothetical protein